jgi:tetraacyldisaccharide 4'-kinase
LHAQDLWGGGQFLPRGYLRDFPQRLKQAKWIVVTHWEEGNSSNQEDIIEQIQKYTDAPIMGLQTKYLLEEEVIRKRKIGAFCGIARPSVFYQALSSFDMQIVKKLSLKDHGTPSLRQLCVFADDCQRLGAKYLVCTEKDLVKWSEKDLDCLPLPLVPLKMEFTCTWNQNVWKEMIQSIKNKM